MGTFHQHKGELHGITVVVDTSGDKIFVGRCDEVHEDRVVLLNVDEHRDGDDGRSKDEYVARAAKFGIWKKFDRLVIPRREVISVRRLGEL